MLTEGLQHDLEVVYDWVETNNMTLNETKFEVVRYGNHPARDKMYKSEAGTEILMKAEVRDLGVWVENNAKFTKHITETVSKCRRFTGWILRTFETRDPMPMLVLYKSLVLPIAEYCCQLWNPSAIGDITKIEGIQRTFTSKIAGFIIPVPTWIIGSD